MLGVDGCILLGMFSVDAPVLEPAAIPSIPLPPLLLRVVAASAAAAEVLLLEHAGDIEIVEGGMRVCSDIRGRGGSSSSSSSSSSSECMQIVVTLKDAWDNAAAAAGWSRSNYLDDDNIHFSLQAQISSSLTLLPAPLPPFQLSSTTHPPPLRSPLHPPHHPYLRCCSFILSLKIIQTPKHKTPNLFLAFRNFPPPLPLLCLRHTCATTAFPPFR